MSLALSLQNLGVWTVHVLLITSIGASLPLVFRIRHPRSLLVYYRLLLAAALVLPFVQPIPHEVILMPDGQTPHPSAPSLSIAEAFAADTGRWNGLNLAFGLIAAGILVRVCWLTGGLWQLRRLRESSAMSHPLPRTVGNAMAAAGADASFRVSSAVSGPVTFGYRRPVILLPKTFLLMPEEMQTSIACHELIHVRRNDWSITVAEEVLASLLWFQPAVWWIVAQCQLAREQLVDTAVISRMSRESYIRTLFALAEARREADVELASLFLKRRHLVHRVHSLLAEVSMSKKRLISSYCLMAVILAVGGVWIVAALPLTGMAEVLSLVPPERPRAVQNATGYVVNRSPIAYPPEAIRDRVEGQVVVELTFNAKGEIVDSRVLSGPETLRRAGLESALKGSYEIDFVRTLQVLVDFKLPTAAAGQRGNAGPRGNGALPVRSFSGVLESINVSGLAGFELAQMQVRLESFRGRLMTEDLLAEINSAIRSSGLAVPVQGYTYAVTDSKNTLRRSPRMIQ